MHTIQEINRMNCEHLSVPKAMISFGLVRPTENESHDWGVGMQGYKIFRRIGKVGKAKSCIGRHSFHYAFLAIRDNVVESL